MDIDFTTTLDIKNGDISIEPGTRSVSGNRALLNQFEITLLTSWRQYFYPDTKQVVEERFGGNVIFGGSSVMNVNNKAEIAAAMTAAIRNAVISIKSDQAGRILLSTERLSSASIESLESYGDRVVAVVNVVPEEIEPESDLKLNLPVINIKEF